MKHFGNQDFRQNEIQNVVFQVMSEVQRDALTPKVGQPIFNTDKNRLEYWNGSEWAFSDATKRQYFQITGDDLAPENVFTLTADFDTSHSIVQVFNKKTGEDNYLVGVEEIRTGQGSGNKDIVITFGDDLVTGDDFEVRVVDTAA